MAEADDTTLNNVSHPAASKSDTTENHSTPEQNTNHSAASYSPSAAHCSTSKSDEEEFFDTVDTSKDAMEESSEDHKFSIGRLKKDDSGIDIEKSPSKDSSAPSEGETNESGTDVSESPQINEASSDSSDSELHPVTADEALRTARRRRRVSSSDSDSDENDDVSTVKMSKSSESEDEMDLEPVVGEPRARQIYTDLVARERGTAAKSSPLTFTETISANLALVERLELQYKLDQHQGCVNALHFSQNGNLLASGSDDLKVIIWDWSHQKPALMFDSGHRNNVFQAKFLPYSGDCHVVTCARDGQVRLAELSTTGVCKNTKKLAQHKGAAHKLALELDSPHVFLSCGEDAATFQIDLREQKPNKLLITKDNDTRVPIYSIHSNPVNSYEFCVAGRDKHVRLYDKRKIAQDSQSTLKKFCPQQMMGTTDNKCNVTCAVYNYNGTEVLGSYNDEDIYLFDTSHSNGADFIKKYHGHRNNATVKGVNFYGPKSEYVVSGSDCGNVYLWEKHSEKVVKFFRGDEGGVVNVLEPHPYGPYLATSGLDSDVKIWAPTAMENTDMKELRSTMKKNSKERREDRQNEPDMLDGQAIWLLMQHLRRTVRRRQETNEDESEESRSDSDSNDSDAVADQCAPS